MSKKIRKLCLSFALAALVGVSAGASACTVQSDHPNAKITISFNDETYEIEYTLYRNMYPQTVQHFIELADAGFYNNTIVHDYKSSDWVAGAYSYDNNDTDGYQKAYSGSFMQQYLEHNCKEEAYYNLVSEGIKSGKFSASVFTKTIYNTSGDETVHKDDALVTLIGEFSQNGHRIVDNKGLSASYGTLKMVYYKKDGKNSVWLKDSFDDIRYGDYNYNCATSLFSMQMSNSTSYSADKYCVFAQLKNDKAKSRLEDLTDAIIDYTTDVLGSSGKFTTSVDTKVDKLDTKVGNDGKFVGAGDIDVDVTFTMTSMPIIIKKVEITKY